MKPLRQFIHLIWPYKRRLLVLLILTSISAVAQVYVPFAFGQLVSLFSSELDASAAYSALALFAGATLLALLAEQIYNWVERYAVPVLRMGIQSSLFATALSQPPVYFETNSGGSIGQAIKQAGRTGVLIAQAACNDLPQILVALLASFVLLFSTGQIGLALFIGAWSIAFTALAVRFAFSARKAVRKFSAASNRSAGEITDILANYETVRAAWTFKEEHQRFSASLAEERDANIESRGYIIRMTMVHAVASWGLIVLILIYCVQQSAHGFSAGQATTAVTLALVLSNMSKSFARTVLNFAETWGTFCQSVEALSDNSNELSLEKPFEPGEKKPIVGTIVFESVSFRYPASSRNALTNISFAIQPGQYVGIVGNSGAGKSTILKMLPGIYAPDSGRILIGAQDITSVSQSDLLSIIGYVAQIPKLFSRTIRENILYERKGATEDEIAAALKATVAEFALSRPDGLNALAGQEGRSFSVGERQRLTLARMVIANKKILLLDEPTSGLDAKSEMLVHACIKMLRAQGHTIICVSHRLNLTKDADLILVVEEGKVKQLGTHHELIHRNGIYSEFWAAQNDTGVL